MSDQPIKGIRVLSDTHCVIDTPDGAYRFDRFCPHQGADLSKVGYYDEAAGAVRCGWHNLPFDLQTGLSPCIGMNGINMEKLCD